LPMAKKVAIRELRRLGEMGLIEIDRSPPVTRTGKQATSFDYDKYVIKVRVKL